MSRFAQSLRKAISAFKSPSELDGALQTAMECGVAALQSSGKLPNCGNGVMRDPACSRSDPFRIQPIILEGAAALPERA
jgi:hypothetical protein